MSHIELNTSDESQSFNSKAEIIVWFEKLISDLNWISEFSEHENYNI